MSPPAPPAPPDPPANPPLAVQLSDADQQALEGFAQSNGLTVEQAATHAVQMQLQARYVVAKRTKNVLRFPK